MAIDATTSAASLVTADQLLAMGTDFHGELIRGRLIEMAPAGWNHGSVAGDALLIIGLFVKKHKLGKVFAAETGFVLERNPDTVRAPDVAFVRADRIPTTGNRRGFFDGPPDLAVEVMSPGDSVSDVLAKANAWLAAGVIEVWVVDPTAQTIAIHRSGITPRLFQLPEMLLDSRSLPGFAEPVTSFFS